MEYQSECLFDDIFEELHVDQAMDEVDIQNLIRNTEEKLRLNTVSIEENLKELQNKANKDQTGDMAQSPVDYLQMFSLRNFGGAKAKATDHQELLDFIHAMQFLLNNDESYASAILELLWNISSQCGVSFPTLNAASTQEPTPLSTPHDNLCLEIHDAWNEVIFLLRRRLQGQLQTLTGPTRGETTSQKIILLQQLSFLCTGPEVLSYYQHLQVKSVLDVLRNSRSCSPGGKKGFDRLALSFQTGFTDILSMLQVEVPLLCSVTEPRNILTFLNQVYLSTVATELSLWMGKEIENVQKDNTSHAVKGGKVSNKKSAVAPQVPSRRERNFCLTSHQLRSLTLLTSTLLELERRVGEVGVHVGLFSFPEESGGGHVEGVSDKVKDAVEMMTAEDKATGSLVMQNAEVNLNFGWRLAFSDVIPQIAHCVKVVLDDVCSKSLQQEEDEHRLSSTQLSFIPVTHTPESSERDSPKIAVKFCAEVVDQMNAFLPLAVAFREDSSSLVCSSFIEVCGHVTSSLLSRIQERAEEVPSSASFKNLCVLMASSDYIHQTLAYYECQLADSRRLPLTLLPFQKSQDVMAALRDQLASYCVNVCATCILQDAESHYWSDPNPFYEGERCSFSIQMWHYFLRGLRRDLWTCVSPVQAQQILAQVLSKTLELLVQRYSRAQPSYKRLLQIRVDITAILLCVEHLIWSVCGSVEDLLKPSVTRNPCVWSIHHLCNQLLTVLAIVTSPLPDFFRIFQNGCGGRDNTIPEGEASCDVFWLSVINPTLFTPDLQRDFPASIGSTLCLFELLVSGPCCNLSLLLQTLLNQECLLLRILITYSNLSVGSDTEMSPDTPTAVAECLEAVFAVFFSLNYVPRALSQALEAYLDQKHLWKHFYSLADTTKEEPELFKQFKRFFCGSISQLLNHLVNKVQEVRDQYGPLDRQLPEHILSKIPTNWNYVSKQAKFSNQSPLPLAVDALSFIFSHLPSIVATIPLPIRFLFTVAEKKLSQHAKQLRSTGLLLRALLCCLCQGLEDGDALERLSGGTKERLALLSECLRVSVGLQKGVAKPLVHKVLQGLEEKRPKWISTQMQKARNLCSESMLEHMESSLVPGRGGPPELTEHKIRQLLLELCHRAGGSQHLGQIHHSIQLNEALLRSILTPRSETRTFPDAEPFLSFKNQQSANVHLFNPFNEIDKFDQAAMVEREWNWAQLLSAYQGVSQVTFIRLLANRWEMQGGAVLEDDEKVLVNQLKRMYFTSIHEA